VHRTLIIQELKISKCIKQHTSLQLNILSSLSYLHDDCHKQAILISESHGNSNWCTPSRGKPDQHATRIQRSVHVWSQTIHISRGQHIATFYEVINRFVQIHCPWEKGLLTQSITQWSSDLWVCTQLLSHKSQWDSGEKTSFYWQQATRLIGLISPTCDRYVQYLLVGANPSVLNWHRKGL
jgi:hypothetical protein